MAPAWSFCMHPEIQDFFRVLFSHPRYHCISSLPFPFRQAFVYSSYPLQVGPIMASLDRVPVSWEGSRMCSGNFIKIMMQKQCYQSLLHLQESYSAISSSICIEIQMFWNTRSIQRIELLNSTTPLQAVLPCRAISFML